MLVSTSMLSRMLPYASRATHAIYAARPSLHKTIYNIGTQRQTITTLAGKPLTKATALTINRQAKRFMNTDELACCVIFGVFSSIFLSGAIATGWYITLIAVPNSMERYMNKKKQRESLSGTDCT